MDKDKDSQPDQDESVTKKEMLSQSMAQVGKLKKVIQNSYVTKEEFAALDVDSITIDIVDCSK
jgi:hypothetical protein